MGKKNLMLSGIKGWGFVVGLEIIVYALFMALLLLPGGEILIIDAVLAAAAIFYLNRKPAFRSILSESFSHNKQVAWGGAIVLLILVPFILASSAYWLFILISAGLFIMACLGLNLQLGSTGMMNLASAAFMGVGAYTASLLALDLGFPVWATMILGTIMAGLFSIILFIPVLKTKGHYLALVTIAFQFMVVILLDNMEWTGGPQGLKNVPLINFFGYSFNQPIDLGFILLPAYANSYYFLLILLFLLGTAAQRIHNSWVGVTLATIRDDEVAAQTSGVRVNNWKQLIFVLGNCFIGLSGAFYSHLVGYISPANFTFEKSLVMVSIVILGGMDNIFGIILGSVLLIVLPEKLRVVQDYRFLIYGLVLIVMLIFQPKGMIPFKPRNYQGLAEWFKPGKGNSQKQKSAGEQS